MSGFNLIVIVFKNFLFTQPVKNVINTFSTGNIQMKQAELPNQGIQPVLLVYNSSDLHHDSDSVLSSSF